ncbi:MAG: LAGLIDADG family homing endonuclease, partial [Actinomycetota bacterium]
MRVLELSLRNYRVFEEVDLEIPARVIGIFGENGAGKCLPGSVRVHDAATGESIPIEQFVKQRRKSVLGLVNGNVVPVDVTDWMEIGERPIVRVQLKNGAALEMASTHPVLTDRGSVKAEDLLPTDWIAEAGTLPEVGPARLSVDEALIVGLLLGDGTLATSVSLSATESTVIDEFRRAVERTFPGCTVNATSGNNLTWIVVSRLSPTERRERSAQLARRLIDAGIPLESYIGANISRFVRGESAISWETMDSLEVEYGIDLYEDRCALHGGRMFLEWARSLGLIGLRAATKRVPPGCLLLPEAQVRALLAGLWLTDGWLIAPRAGAIGTNSLQLARDVRTLLLRLGLASTMTVHRGRSRSPNYRVNLTADALRRFVEVIPLVGPKAAQAVEIRQMLAGRRSWPNTDLIPPSFNAGMASRSADGRYRSKRQLARHAMSRDVFLDFGGDPSIAAAEVRWSQVRSVEAIGSAPCFDISVDTNEHLYIAETFIVHNSSLVEAIAFALYGADASRTKKQEIRTHGVLTDCEVRVVFEHAGSQFEVRRSIKGRGHTPEAELYGGDLLLASGTTDVDAELRRLLHMDLHVFRSSVYAEQKQLDAFSDLSPARRKEMALRLLG